MSKSYRPPVSQQGSPLFEAGFMYPLVDSTRYDDEFGEGYAYVAIAPDASPGECWIHDGWIVNEAGRVHPGLSENAVPIRRDDVDFSKARPIPQRAPLLEGFSSLALPSP